MKPARHNILSASARTYYTHKFYLQTCYPLLTRIKKINHPQKRRIEMYSYGLLEPGCYYLVQEKESSPIELIKVVMESDHCMYVFKYHDEMLTEWKRKNDTLNDIIECLSDDMVGAWRKQYDSNEGAYFEEDDE